MDIIKIENLGKKYKKYRNKFGRLFEWIYRKKMHEEHWVLRNVNLTIKPGESVGIIGQNGAGKSTMLKLLTGTTQPTEGSVQINGRVAALLELGMGFHPDLTGRQNTYITGQLLGISNEEMTRLMPEIEAFAEIGSYMDQPLRTYSSGMSVRVAFAAATAVRPDILIVDEALSVGDAYFQHKCFSKIREFREQGTTLLFVSHDPGAVKNLCNKAILLDKGELIKEGNPEEIIDYYNAIIAKKEADLLIVQSKGKGKLQTRSGDGIASILDISIFSENNVVNAVQVGENVDIKIKFKCLKQLSNPTIGLLIKDRLGNDIFGTNTFYQDIDLGICEEDEIYMVSFKFPVNIGYGHYSITVAIHEGSNHIQGNHDWWDHAELFQVIPGNEKTFIGVNFLPAKCNFYNKLKDDIQ